MIIMLVDLRSIRRVIMNREVLWRFNYKFPLVGFRLRKKERKNKTTTKKLSNNLFSLWFSLGLLLRLVMFPWKREQLWIYFVGTLSVWIFFLCFLWQSFRLSASVYPVLFRLTASPCLYLMSFRIAIIRCSSSLDYVCTRIFWLFKQMCQ